MSKFLLNLLLQISKALINSKTQFLIQKSFFLRFWLGRPCGPLGLRPSRLPLASPLPQAEAHRPTQAAQPACTVGVIPEVRFLHGFTLFVLDAFSLSSADAWVPRVSPVFPTAPADPCQKFPRVATPPCRCPAPRMP
jgi:hypothetical protein